MIHNLYKQRGETPLECLERFRCQRLPLTHEKMTYLGRLDPMAEGVLLVGSGEEDTKQKRREEFFSLDKMADKYASLPSNFTKSVSNCGRFCRTFPKSSWPGHSCSTRYHESNFSQFERRAHQVDSG